MQPSGFNPMRWDCDKNGCFNLKRRPKIELFADCFPRRINFGDVDGLVELNGSFCLLEWKGAGGSVKRGQELTFRQFTKSPHNVVFIVDGDAETMNISRYQLFWHGVPEKWEDGNLDVVKERIQKWVAFVEGQKVAA